MSGPQHVVYVRAHAHLRASSAYLASRDVAAERTASETAASPSSIVALNPASASTGSAAGDHNAIV
jgi:hypothetical protein